MGDQKKKEKRRGINECFRFAQTTNGSFNGNQPIHDTHSDVVKNRNGQIADTKLGTKACAQQNNFLRSTTRRHLCAPILFSSYRHVLVPSQTHSLRNRSGVVHKICPMQCAHSQVVPIFKIYAECDPKRLNSLVCSHLLGRKNDTTK